MKYIEELNLSVRSYNALKANDIETVDQLVKLTEEDLYSLRNLGKKSVNELLNTIERIKTTQTDTRFSIDEHISIDVLTNLSNHAYNTLLFRNIKLLSEIIHLSSEELMNKYNLSEMDADEIALACQDYLVFHKEELEVLTDNSSTFVTIQDYLHNPEMKNKIVDYVREHDIKISDWDVSVRVVNACANVGIEYVSQLVEMYPIAMNSIDGFGKKSFDILSNRMKLYLDENTNRFIAICTGDYSELYSIDELKKMILDLFYEHEFDWYSYADMMNLLNLPDDFDETIVRKSIGQLLQEKQLEYVDYRLYRICGKFSEWIDQYPDLTERNRTILNLRLSGQTLQQVADNPQINLTRERVRQIVEKSYNRIKNNYVSQTHISCFDEEYYSYLYLNYEFDLADGIKWFGLSESIYQVLELNESSKRKKIPLENALEDENLPIGLRFKIKNYLNRDYVYLEGKNVKKSRRGILKFLIEKYAINQISIDELFERCKKFSLEYDLPYFLDDTSRSFEGFVERQEYIVRDHHKLIRYYDFQNRDFSELMDTLALDSYDNVILSTQKFMNEYPELIERYDIHNKNELHNLLKTISPKYNITDTNFDRMPHISFGKINMEEFILNVLIEKCPIRGVELADYFESEYGIDSVYIQWNGLKKFQEYNHHGTYIIDQKQMSLENQSTLLEELHDNIYTFKELQDIYHRILPQADISEINAYNLKNMGFNVFSQFVIRKCNTLYDYVNQLIQNNGKYDLSDLANRFKNVSSFHSVLNHLKAELQILEIKKNYFISFAYLEERGISKDVIEDFRDKIYNTVPSQSIFTLQSLKLSGFNHEMLEMGLTDLAIQTLIAVDPRIGYLQAFGTYLFKKNTKSISLRDLVVQAICEHESINMFDLIDYLKDSYGCSGANREKIKMLISDSDIYYDEILDMLYRNENIYENMISEELEG